LIRTEAEATASAVDYRPTEHVEFVLLVIPDVNGSLRGKALRPDAFDAAVRHGTVMTDLLLALDPVDMPIADYERFGIRSGAADLVVHPDTSTLHDLRWRPGWRVCLGTPSWPDGARCELASREVLRGVLAQMQDVGYDAVAAIEYEMRLSDENDRLITSGISYSAGEVTALDPFVSALRPALDDLGVELTAVHTEAAPGLVELNLAARPALEAVDGHAGELSRQDGTRGGRIQRSRAPLLLARGDERVCRRPDAGVGDRGRARAPARGLALAQPHDQLVQAARARLLRAHQRELGRRKPIVRGAGDPFGSFGAQSPRVPAAGGRRQPIPRPGGDRGVRR